MIRKLLILLLLPVAMMAQERSLLPVVSPDLRTMNSLTFNTSYVGFVTGNSTSLVLDGGWSDLTLYNHQDHGAMVRSNAYRLIIGSNLGNPDAEKDLNRSLIFYPNYYASLYTQKRLSKLNVGGAVRSDSVITDTLVVTQTMTAKAAVVDSLELRGKLMLPSMPLADSLAHVITEIQRPFGATYPMGVVKIVAHIGPTQYCDFGIVADSANNVVIAAIRASTDCNLFNGVGGNIHNTYALGMDLGYYDGTFRPSSTTGPTFSNPIVSHVRTPQSSYRRLYRFTGGGASYCRWEFTVTFIMKNTTSTSGWYIKVID